MNFCLRGLYLIADIQAIDAARFLTHVEQAILGGAQIVQYRDKTDNAEIRFKQAKSLKDMCTKHSIPLIINDDPKLAKEIDAHGIHIGKTDIDIQRARKYIGADRIIGVSCYNDLQRAIELQDHANYISFGAFYPSNTKPLAVKADPQLLEQARKVIHLPICAIGGITPDNSQILLHSGADMLAVVSAIFTSTTPQHVAKQFAQLWQ